uniref:DDE_Tnp_1_7 domain-containing protein n=1 Tax=Steinernema glaseri TaxID=37863 RepID=A0A1I7Z029_9BILA
MQCARKDRRIDPATETRKSRKEEIVLGRLINICKHVTTTNFLVTGIISDPNIDALCRIKHWQTPKNMNDTVDTFVQNTKVVTDGSD